MDLPEPRHAIMKDGKWLDGYTVDEVRAMLIEVAATFNLEPKEVSRCLGAPTLPRRAFENSAAWPALLKDAVGVERERCALLCEDLASIMEWGAGDPIPGGRLRQAARNIRDPQKVPMGLSDYSPSTGRPSEPEALGALPDSAGPVNAEGTLASPERNQEEGVSGISGVSDTRKGLA